ncbi:MAG: glycosyl hydrolase, partial [Abditibacteriales bacterium]|nr:glycosyl hydrolase [Abditibacteriales bacterium]
MMADFARQFHTPPREFAPVPFWCWNDDVREEELLSQLRQLQAKGCGGFILAPRHGLRVPFLSERWFQLVRLVVGEAARLRLRVWLYDDESWPSGTVGGRLSQRPELRGRCLRFYDVGTWERGNVERLQRFATEGEKLIYAAALPVPAAGEHWNLARAVNLTASPSPLTPHPSSLFRVFAFTEVAYGYIDPLNPAVAEGFLRTIHEAYASACGEHLGNTVVGVFMDEPALVSVWEMREKQFLPWSSRLPQEFKEEHGYDLIPFLPSLILDTGVSASQVRQDFWQTVRRLYVSNFFAPIARWCAEHRLALAGHLLFEEPLYRQVRFQGDALSVYRQMHVPGVDHAGVERGGLHHKLCASTAHQSGNRRVLSHTFGGCGWGVSLAERKAAVDWQLAMGVNLIAPHALYYSIRGKRKRESPPSDRHEPHWRYYQHFSDYVARLCWALSQGRHVAKVCVLYPSRSAWAQPADATADDVEKDLFYVCDQLTRLHYDYDFIHEDTLVS